MTALTVTPLSNQFIKDATSLFNNMKTPASILAGTMVPLGILNTLPKHDTKPETKLMKIVRQTYLLVSVFSFGSEVLAVMYLTMAVNKLTETAIAPAASLIELLKRDFALAWTGTNSHFIFGMFGLMYMICVRSFFMVRVSNTNKYFASSIYSVVGSLFFLMLSAVNKQVAAGPGEGKNVVDLFSGYVRILYKQVNNKGSFGTCQAIGLALGIVSVAGAMMGSFEVLNRNTEKEE